MENNIALAVRTAFIAHKIAQRLTNDSVSSELTSLAQSDPLTAMIQAYFLCLGIASNDKANLFAFKRLLAEAGLRHTVPDDMMRAISAECQAIVSDHDPQPELASFARTCSDPYRDTSNSIVHLGLNLDPGNEKLRCLEEERKRIALEEAARIRLERESRVLEKAKETVKSHSTTLARKKRQLVILDDYGIPDRKKWNDEVRYFITNVVLPSLEQEEFSNLLIGPIFEYIDEVAITTERLPEDKDTQEATPELSPRDFEAHCSALLQRQGWNTSLTEITGDQGIDIVAERNGLKLVFQCKQYSNPVGNKAVQEAHAGKDFLGADMAVVVTNASFTTSAKELGASLNVLLLHHTQLDEFDKVLFLNARKR